MELDQIDGGFREKSCRYWVISLVHFVGRKQPMDFSWTDEQLAYKKAVIDFARKELNQEMIQRDKERVFIRELWKKCADFGIQGMAVPEEYGGSEADILTTMLTMEGLGYGCLDNGLIFGINAQMWSVQHPILAFGTEAQKQKYLPGMFESD